MTEEKLSNKEKLAGVVLVAGVGLCSAIGGFSWTLAGVQRLESKSQGTEVLKLSQKATLPSAAQLHAEGVQLATRALAWGSLWAISGCCLFAASVWLVSGAKNFEEFRQKMGAVLPKLSRSSSNGATNINNFDELLEHLTSKK